METPSLPLISNQQIKFMKSTTILNVLFAGTILCVSCTNPPKDDTSAEAEEMMNESPEEQLSYSTDDPKSIIKAVEMANGTWDKLWEQKDVQFDYYYKQADGKIDESVERYVFDTEESWAKYTKHEINVLPETEGIAIQYYDGDSAFVSLDGEAIENPEAIGVAKFLRKANYFWFVMMYKLDNPGANYDYMGQESVKGMNYDKVKVTYEPKVTGKEQNDTYILYVNPETKMVDQFYFSLPAFGVNEPVILMTLEYSEIDGLQIPTTRNIYMPGENGYSEEPNLVEVSENVKFNNGFTEDSMQL